MSGWSSAWQGVNVALTGPSVASLLDYWIVWEPLRTAWEQGSSAIPLQWLITRRDGGNVPSPTNATVMLTLPDQTVMPFTGTSVDVSSGAPAAQMRVGVYADMPQFGDYHIALSVILDLADGSRPQTFDVSQKIKAY